MTIRTHTSGLKTLQTEALLVPVAQPAREQLSQEVQSFLPERVLEDFSGKQGEVQVCYLERPGIKRLVLVGMGDQTVGGAGSIERWRRAIGRGVRELLQRQVTELAVLVEIADPRAL